MNRPQQITVGQEVFVATSGSWETTYRLGTVVKITSGGQVTVSIDYGNALAGRQERRFTSSDREIGQGDSYRVPYLAWNVSEIKARLASDLRVRNAGDAIRKANKIEPTRGDDEQSLLAKINEMRAHLAAAEAVLKA